MNLKKIGLLPRIIAAIILGILIGQVLPGDVVRFFATINGLFSNFLSFIIPLIIIGLVTPGIADLGKSAGKLLVYTTVIAYASTLFSGFFTYFVSLPVFTTMLQASGMATELNMDMLPPYFTLEMPPFIEVISALILSFILGIGISLNKGTALKTGFTEFKQIVERVISGVIIPLLPLYIFGIFLNMANTGAAFHVINMFAKVIAVIFMIHIVILLIQFGIAGLITRRNPLRLLYTMLPAYVTALGTSSSAACIPVTLRQTIKNKVNEDIASFIVPLCATIHLAGSIMKIVSISLAICIINGYPYDLQLFTGFIFMVAIMMIAAPGVPGGAIMAATGLIQSFLGFDPASIGLMIAVYMAIDSFGTACNVTGDGAIALIINKIAKKEAVPVEH